MMDCQATYTYHTRDSGIIIVTILIKLTCDIVIWCDLHIEFSRLMAKASFDADCTNWDGHYIYKYGCLPLNFTTLSHPSRFRIRFYEYCVLIYIAIWAWLISSTCVKVSCFNTQMLPWIPLYGEVILARKCVIEHSNDVLELPMNSIICCNRIPCAPANVKNLYRKAILCQIRPNI